MEVLENADLALTVVSEMTHYFDVSSGS